MENTVNAIREKAELLSAYADLLVALQERERWHMHTDDDDGEHWVDDDYASAKYALIAVRETMKAVKKLAGV